MARLVGRTKDGISEKDVAPLVAQAIADDDTVAQAAAAAVTDELASRDLITQAEADGLYATAEQGGKADTAVQPSTGLRGQVLTMGATERQWQDVPGIVYPSLLLSPNESRDRNGPVTPTVDANVEIVEGQYGQAWQVVEAGGIQINPNTVSIDKGTVLARVRFDTEGAAQTVFHALDGNPIDRRYLRRGGNKTQRVSVQAIDNLVSVDTIPTHTWVNMSFSWDQGVAKSHLNGILLGETTYTPAGDAIDAAFVGVDNTGGAQIDGLIESVLIFPESLSEAEVQRISTMTEPWTMQNAAANLYQPQSAFQLFAPNRAIATGGTTLRTAPGAATQDITTLAAATLVEMAIGSTVNSGGVDYTLIRTQSGHQGYVPATALVAL